MSLADDLTVMILTFNEEANIGRTLASVAWARHILVVDSGSTDKTLEIVRSYSQAQIVGRELDSFANQCNFGVERISTSWVLSLDADYELSPDLAREMAALEPSDTIAGYAAGFVYCIHGRPLRSTLYPPRTVLYRRAKARYRDEGHGHRVAIDGRVVPLRGRIRHDDRKPLSRWLASQQRYARIEADHLLATPRDALSRVDRLRLMGWPAPPLMFLYALLWKRCLLDGWPGWLYVMQRTLAETMLAIEIVDRRIGRTGGKR